MTQYRCIEAWTQILRVVLVAALMLFVPLTGPSHAMPAGAAMAAAGHDMGNAHNLTTAGKMPASHNADIVSCRLLCFGWVQASDAIRPEAPVLVLIAALTAGRFDLPEGIPPAPIGHPPKPAPAL